ncbi:hypothetical protein K440DRAFT_399062 [Wilcoxina mikolae CBS 423.85]|nr:hypothetical protein K440DRAFT_399062 [Wilcoxina mikolae CBS 423.85]
MTSTSSSSSSSLSGGGGGGCGETDRVSGRQNAPSRLKLGISGRSSKAGVSTGGGWMGCRSGGRKQQRVLLAEVKGFAGCGKQTMKLQRTKLWSTHLPLMSVGSYLASGT